MQSPEYRTNTICLRFALGLFNDFGFLQAMEILLDCYILVQVIVCVSFANFSLLLARVKFSFGF